VIECSDNEHPFVGAINWVELSIADSVKHLDLASECHENWRVHD
jgi:hypothetical protein